VALRSISLFAGGGGLDLALERANIARTVCRVEHEVYSAAVLAARSSDLSLDDAPIWSEAQSFAGRPWRGVVDLVYGGFPCQDISRSGSGAGIEGSKSGLWFEFARLIQEIEPGFIFVENVGTLRKRGLKVILGQLASYGFDAEWDCFRASDIGAPHNRERMFILGYNVANAKCNGSQVQLEDWSASGSTQRASRGNQSFVPWPPGPRDRSGWEEYIRRYPMLEPAIRRGTDGSTNRVQRLRLLGNSVVPDQATYAWHTLYHRMMAGRG
jgi:DNA (cytosine-5)-methyltransferase 1